MLIMLIAAGCVFGGIAGYHAMGNMMMKKYFSSQTAPAVSVSVMKAPVEEWQSEIKAVGTLRASHGVDVSTESAGQVREVSFNSGDMVTQGKLLLELNADTDIAQLRALQASAALSRSVYDRDKKQFEIQAVSQSVLDADAAELKVRMANVTRQMRLIEQKFIRAPFTGKLGISAISRGQYVNVGEKIVALQALDSVYVDFYVPQQDLSRMIVGQDLELFADPYPGKTFAGKIVAIDPVVAVDSRNVHIEAEVPNPAHELLPGMYVSVVVKIGRPFTQVTLPQTVIQYNPYGETVFIVSGDTTQTGSQGVKKARQVFVTLGDVRGDQVAVLKGVEAGDAVVTAGQHKLRNGVPVVVMSDQPQPGNDPAPHPVDQ
jgi:membrane fusion protein (multidrug efflux system)